MRNETDLIGYGLDLGSIGMSIGKTEELMEIIDELRISDIPDDKLSAVSVCEYKIVFIILFFLFIYLGYFKTIKRFVDRIENFKVDEFGRSTTLVSKYRYVRMLQ